MKYLEQRVEELELEVKLLKAKNKLEETKLPEYYPPYPNVISSWNDNDLVSFNQTDNIPPYPGHYNTNLLSKDKNFNDVINENITDDCGIKMNYEEPSTSWGFESEFDKQDKNFLEYLNSTEKRIEKDFGKIISKFKILTHEWEMDGYGYIVRDLECNKNIVVTNHGKPMVVNKSYLNDIISGYKERIQETERAMFLVK
jgi:hypothetical protein